MLSARAAPARGRLPDRRLVACARAVRSGRLLGLRPSRDPRYLPRHLGHGDRRHRAFAERVAATLVRNYLTPVSPTDRRPPGILTEGCYNARIGLAVKNELIWGTYYLLESTLALSGRIDPLAL